MKLRNKKTGEIIEKYPDRFVVNSGEQIRQYDSLAELNEEWEDYEDPKGWCITMYGGISRINKDDEILISELKEIGNYFNDKESAYDALDKLKAWKRLKDKGFKFGGWKRDERFCGDYTIEAQDDVTCDNEDLGLLFGGEA